MSDDSLRNVLQYIYNRIGPGCRVLDLGCGDGKLIKRLKEKKGCLVYGVEIDARQILKAVENGVNVIQSDVDRGLHAFDDKSFDFVVLSQTIQAMKNTQTILKDMMRVADNAFVSFPNFGYWRNRAQLGFGGHMPNSESMPYDWYDTPNIHWCTLVDFDRLCAKSGIAVRERTVLTNGKVVSFLPNLLGSLALYWIGDKQVA